MKLSKYFLSALVFVILVNTSCDNKSNSILYQKEYSQEEKMALAESLSNGAGTDLYYQGEVGERMIIWEGLEHNPEGAWGWREIGVPYLKRGFAYEANKYYSKAVEHDPEEWLGYKAYCWLYFYRDYETAIRELDRFDAFTPDFVDYPQATSVDFMRGVAYLRLGKLDSALEYLEKHLLDEKENTGAEYIEPKDYLMLGVAWYEKGDFKKALEVIDEGILHNDTTADLYYYRALVTTRMKDVNAAKIYLDKAEYLIDNGGKNIRPYIEEFYAVYQQDVEKLRKEFMN